MAPRWTCHLRLVGSLQHHHCGVRRWGAQETVDAEAVKGVFPYGSVFLQVVDGGLRASSGVAIPALGAPPPPPPPHHTHTRAARGDTSISGLSCFPEDRSPAISITTSCLRSQS